MLQSESQRNSIHLFIYINLYALDVKSITNEFYTNGKHSEKKLEKDRKTKSKAKLAND